jgi:hypothetical protein
MSLSLGAIFLTHMILALISMTSGFGGSKFVLGTHSKWQGTIAGHIIISSANGQKGQTVTYYVMATVHTITVLIFVILMYSFYSLCTRI